MTDENEESLENYKHESKLASSWRKFKQHKGAYLGLIVLIVVILISIVVPMVAPYNYDYVDMNAGLSAAPSWSHWFGTDGNGRDLLVRTTIGVRISLTVGLLASFVSLTIGVIYGIVAGYFGGKLDTVMIRAVDIISSIPTIFILLALMVVFDGNIYVIFISIGALGWMGMARVTRGQTISIKNRDFVEATHAYSLPKKLIMKRHILPHMLGTVMIFLTLGIPGAIMTESFLSFLGLGVREPLTSLGTLLSDAAPVIEYYPYMFFLPLIFFVLLFFSFNFIGDGLRNIFDEKNY